MEIVNVLHVISIIVIIITLICAKESKTRMLLILMLLLNLMMLGWSFVIWAATMVGAICLVIVLCDAAMKWLVHEKEVEAELQKQIVDGKETQVTFDAFPYYLDDMIRETVKAIGFIYLRRPKWSDHIRNLLLQKPSVLLLGPSELYMQMLAKALSNFFGAKLLVLDMANFKFKVRCKNGCPNQTWGFPRNLFQVTKTASDLLHVPVPFKGTHWCFSERSLIQSLQKVLVSVSKTDPAVLYIRDAEDLLKRSTMMYYLFQHMLDDLSKRRVVIIGSKLVKPGVKYAPSHIANLFSHSIEIVPPSDESSLSLWRSQMKNDAQTVKTQYDRNFLKQILEANNMDCDDLDSVYLPADRNLESYMKDIVLGAISRHFYGGDPEFRSGKLIICSTALSKAYRNIENFLSAWEKKNVVPERKVEQNTNLELVPPNRINVTFDNIGALDKTKELLQELVMLPLRRPELFKTGLLKSCRGILLFGPPGTGKTMLAKALARESGAKFISATPSNITAKWYGEAEKNVKELFALAAKSAPTIIFMDEVDSLLSQQRNYEGNHVRRVKNEFLSQWDGLLSEERILVLGATNRPFDLDDAVIRRFERRIMVGLPSKQSRELILKKLLSKENVEGVDYQMLAAMTEGYTGSDLKNLCVAAAYYPVRDLLKKEKENMMQEEVKQKTDPEKKTLTEKPTIPLRPVNMEDLLQAKNQIAASFPTESAAMNQLKQWNEQYGEGGSGKQGGQLGYFL